MTTVDELTIAVFDPDNASEGELRARHALLNAIELETAPEDPPTPYGAMVQDLRIKVSWRKSDRWAIWDGPHHVRMLGYATFDRQYTESNRNLGWFWIEVDGDHRRQHLGTRLLEKVVEAAEADGRTIVGAGAVRDSEGAHFLDALGATDRALERKSRLDLRQVDDTLLERWVADAAVKAPGYSLVAWDGPTPEEHIEAYVRIIHVMNTAPRDDLDMEDSVHTVERQRESEEKSLAKGDWWCTICARHDESGEFAGFSDIYFSKWFDDLCWQGGTAVDPVHRGKSIGRWLKAAMIQHLKAEKPQVWRIDTWNAGSNEYMLAINNDLGFEAVQWFGAWQVPTAELRAAVAKRLGS
jgi:GNAT superfamily N-acetyltransferase